MKITNQCRSGRLAQSAIRANLWGLHFYRVVVDVPFGGTLSVHGRNIVSMGTYRLQPDWLTD